MQLHSFPIIHASVRDKLPASRVEIIRKQHAQYVPSPLVLMKRLPKRTSKLTPKVKVLTLLQLICTVIYLKSFILSCSVQRLYMLITFKEVDVPLLPNLSIPTSITSLS